jgi:hypothetical protein
MTDTSFSTPAKNLIRQRWAKPLLEFIHDHLGQKLLYLGLPGAGAEDIMEWIEFLHTIFAFQCEDERYPDAFKNLFDKLDLLEQQEKIDSFSLFDGFMEQVIMEGVDNQNNIFNLNDIVTLYNLDFCNQIDFPIKSQTKEGEPLLIGKLDAIKRLLEIQNSIADMSSKFVLFLTIHCSYKDKQTKIYLERQPYKQYIANTNKSLKGKGHERNARSLRLYIIENLKTFFLNEGFIPEFLPTVYYQGLGDAPLLLFTIVGTRGNVELSDEVVSNLINSKFLTPNEDNSSFENQMLEELEETDNKTTDSVEAFTSSETFNNYWQNH